MSDRMRKGFGRFAAAWETMFAFPEAKSRTALVRPRNPRLIAGVCSGVAEAYGWDVALVRVLLLVSAVASTGLLGVGYLIAWVLIPEAPYALPGSTGTTAS